MMQWESPVTCHQSSVILYNQLHPTSLNFAPNLAFPHSTPPNLTCPHTCSSSKIIDDKLKHPLIKYRNMTACLGLRPARSRR